MKLYKVAIFKQYLLPKEKKLDIFNRGVIYRKKQGVNLIKTTFPGTNFLFSFFFALLGIKTLEIVQSI